MSGYSKKENIHPNSSNKLFFNQINFLEKSNFKAPEIKANNKDEFSRKLYLTTKQYYNKNILESNHLVINSNHYDDLSKKSKIKRSPFQDTNLQPNKISKISIETSPNNPQLIGSISTSIKSSNVDNQSKKIEDYQSNILHNFNDRNNNFHTSDRIHTSHSDVNVECNNEPEITGLNGTSTPNITDNTQNFDQLISDLEYLGLPQSIADVMKQKNIHCFFEWQRQCLYNNALLNGKNFFINLPTSGGKTLIAEIILLRSCHITKKNSILILPYVSLVVEKTKSIKKYAKVLNYRVESYYNNKGRIPVPKENNICICTLEKANAVINSLIDEDRIHDLGTIVIDEIHMINDSERGFLIELIISKLKYLENKVSVQVVGLSATLPNIHSFVEWIGGDYYVNKNRPVPLTEYIKMENTIYDKEFNTIRKLPMPNPKDNEILSKFKVYGLSTLDLYHIHVLCQEVVPEHSVLVFCSSKRLTVTLANILTLLSNNENAIEDRLLTIKAIKSAQGDGMIDGILEKSILKGIAYHNSGLTADEREIIENAFRDKIINIICCTSTLAAGVNLPAKRIILQPRMGPRYISKIEYQQMIGRAGRKGLNEEGESFLLLSSREKDKGIDIIASRSIEVMSSFSTSCFMDSNCDIKVSSNKKSITIPSGLDRLFLDCIAGKKANTRVDCQKLLRSTFFGYKLQDSSICMLSDMIIGWLIDNGFIKEVKRIPDEMLYLSDTTENSDTDLYSLSGALSETVFETNPLGLSTFRSSFSPSESLIIAKELMQARDHLVLSDPLHLCYLVTPINQTIHPNSWIRWSNIFHNLESKRMKLASTIGIHVHHLLTKEEDPNARLQDNIENKIKRFFSALMLMNLANEKSVWDVAREFSVSKGDIESLMVSASTFGTQMVHFCKTMGWWDLELLLGQYAKIVGLGVRSEIIPLTEIKGVKSFRAKLLWEKGYRTVKQIACAKDSDIAKVLEGTTNFSMGIARRIIANAQKVLEKTVQELRETANKLLDKDTNDITI